MLAVANSVLEHAIGESASRATATWTCQLDDRDRPLLTVRVADSTGESGIIRFTPDELQPPDKARRRFIRLWGDILALNSKKQLRVLQTIDAEE